MLYRNYLNSVIKDIIQNKLLFIILLVGAMLRFIGIYPGYPPQHPDEAPYSSAIEMIHNNNLDPLRYDYPSGVAIIMLLFFKFFFIPLGWIKVLILNAKNFLNGEISIPFSENAYRILHEQVYGRWENDVLFWGRYVTALFGVGVVFLTYILGKRIYGKTTGLIAAFFVAINFRQVLNSHIGLPDIYNAFFLLLSFILALNLLNKSSLKNYILVGVGIGLSFSIKYQIFALIPFLLINIFLLYKAFSKNSLKAIKFFPISNFITAILVALLTTILINPYHLIKIDQFLIMQNVISVKYGMGINQLNFYPLSYLYQYGIGQILSWLILLGIVLGVLKYFKKSLILLTVILPFFYIFIYYSRGGFYTRNFVTIIPILLIFAALPLSSVFNFFAQKSNQGSQKLLRKFQIIAFISVLLFISWSNLSKSITIADQFSKPWGLEVLKNWVTENIPDGSKVSANSNVPLPESIHRLSYESEKSISVDEFREEGEADFAITNFAWATNEFYWWMNVDPKNGLRFWNKPVNILEYSYSALVLRELESFTIYSIFKPWYAPGNDFLVVKVPKIKVTDKNKVITQTFDKDQEGWEKTGQFWESSDNLNWENGSLIVEQKPSPLPSIRWQSPVIDVSNWPGFVLSYKLQTKTTLQKIKGGYIFVNLYKTSEDAKISQNRIGVRISSRVDIPNQWIEKELAGKIPYEAKFMTIGFSNYNSGNAESLLDELSIYKANVDYDFQGYDVIPTHIDEGNLFPNSHGNL